MKLLLIIMDYFLLQFDTLIFFLRVCLHGGSLPNFNLFNVNPEMFRQNRKVHLSNCLETNLHNISNMSLRIIKPHQWRSGNAQNWKTGDSRFKPRSRLST